MYLLRRHLVDNLKTMEKFEVAAGWLVYPLDFIHTKYQGFKICVSKK